MSVQQTVEEVNNILNSHTYTLVTEYNHTPSCTQDRSNIGIVFIRNYLFELSEWAILMPLRAFEISSACSASCNLLDVLFSTWWSDRGITDCGFVTVDFVCQANV